LKESGGIEFYTKIDELHKLAAKLDSEKKHCGVLSQAKFHSQAELLKGYFLRLISQNSYGQ